MYIPSEFQETDSFEVLDFISAHPLGILITFQNSSKPAISHLPFLLTKNKDTLVLESHLAKKNPQSSQLVSGIPVTLVFQGNNGYISSSVYTHQNVPTWNYQAVHIFGTLELLSREELKEHLSDSIDFFESIRHQQVRFKELDPDMVNAFLEQIIGIRIQVTEFEAAYKLSQNRKEVDFKAIVEDLDQSGSVTDRELSSVMKKQYKFKA